VKALPGSLWSLSRKDGPGTRWLSDGQCPAGRVRDGLDGLRYKPMWAAKTGQRSPRQRNRDRIRRRQRRALRRREHEIPGGSEAEESTRARRERHKGSAEGVGFRRATVLPLAQGADGKRGSSWIEADWRSDGGWIVKDLVLSATARYAAEE